MKKLAGSLLVAAAISAAGGAHAAFIDDISPLVGIDYQHVWMKARGDWQNVFPKSFPGGTVYVGARFCECLGIEFGYDWSAKRTHDFNLPSGTFFGNTTVLPVIGTARLRRTGGHFDLIGYLPVADCLELMGVLGVGYVYPKIHITTLTSAGGNTAYGNVNSGLQSVAGRGKTVARVRFGGSYMFTECVGLRALVGWESTSSLRVKGNTGFAAAGLANKAFRGTATAAAGVFVKF